LNSKIVEIYKRTTQMDPIFHGMIHRHTKPPFKMVHFLML
jgi:hypothetical protein